MAFLSPTVVQQFFDDNGEPASGYQIFTYAAGSVSKIATYTDETADTANTDPIILDARGEANIWLLPGVAYKFVFAPPTDTDPPTNPIWTVDNILVGTPVSTDVISANTTAAPYTNYVAIAPLNLTIPLSTTLTTAFFVTGFAEGGAVTIVPNAADAINGGTAGASLTVPKGYNFQIVTDADGNLYVWYTPSGVLATLPLVGPQGRLSLTSGSAIDTGNVSGGTTIYYTPYQGGNLVPVYNGTALALQTFTGLSLALDGNSGHTGYQASGNLYDIFAFMLSGVLTLGTGPAWNSSTARGTGAGTTQLSQLSGVWTNAVAITLRYGSASGNTQSVPINEATYLGTMYAASNGTCSMNYQTSTTALPTGGCSLGLWNAYNRVRVNAQTVDVTASWSSASGWRPLDFPNFPTGNRVSWVDGLRQSQVEAKAQIQVETAGASADFVDIGIVLDSTSATPTLVTEFASISTTVAVNTQSVTQDFFPQLGFHFAQAMENSNNTANTLYGTSKEGSIQVEFVSLSLEM